MAKLYFFPRASCESSDPDSRQPSEVLERAIAKMVQVGAKVGVSADQMIELLDAGMTVEELLEYVLSLAHNLPEEGGKSSAKSGFKGEMRVQDESSEERGDCHA
jgi:hypothetical protein